MPARRKAWAGVEGRRPEACGGGSRGQPAGLWGLGAGDGGWPGVLLREHGLAPRGSSPGRVLRDDIVGAEGVAKRRSAM